jgi:hypothetical protein
MAQLRGDALTERCQKLGIDTMGEYMNAKEMQGRIRSPRATDAELQQRLHDYERSVRESRMWVMALISALASLASAVVAVVAVLGKLPIS